MVLTDLQFFCHYHYDNQEGIIYTASRPKHFACQTSIFSRLVSRWHSHSLMKLHYVQKWKNPWYQSDNGQNHWKEYVQNSSVSRVSSHLNNKQKRNLNNKESLFSPLFFKLVDSCSSHHTQYPQLSAHFVWSTIDIEI